ncbi:unnamed protein product [Oppiella nova]|uniref:Uncharacterized protein n=1 Tax=Oppiella nova TaxID=334625 RepID=A0A7R9M0G0_9ACAR|nr:unnamed protein product [Oppiella nova]CAG2168746.1 unnamed protein product [Oppiella nova]
MDTAMSPSPHTQCCEGSPMATTSATDMLNVWPKVGVFLMNSCGQCGYQWLPQTIRHKVLDIITKQHIHHRKHHHNAHHHNPDGNEDNNRTIESTIYEMIFGSVALNFCAQNSSKIHRLSDDLLMTSFIFQIDFSNGRIIHKKYGLAIIWSIGECDGQLRQLILKETLIMDALINELRNELIESRLKSPKHIHTSVTKLMKSVNDYLSVCRLTSRISDDQFIDELIALINGFDTKSTHFFVSHLLTSILMFKYKANKMKLILWSNDVNKVSFVSQLLIVINQFLRPNTQTISYLTPQMKSIKFCHNFDAMKRTSSVTPITKSIISERKSRDESLGYESLTESGSTTTSTICDYNGFAPKSMDTSTPLEQSLEQSVDAIDTELELPVDPNDDSMQTPSSSQSSSQLIQSKNYFREYRNLRFTSDGIFDDCTDEEDIHSLDSSDNCLTNGDKYSYCLMNGVNDDDDFGSDAVTDVEEIRESHVVSGFGEISMPQLIADVSAHTNEISLSQSPTISDTYLSQISIQGIINSKTIGSYDELIAECLRKSTNDLNDNTVIVCDCDLWRIHYIESSRSQPAIMSSSVGQLCETIAQLSAIQMNSQFIMRFIDNKINELIDKSIVLKSLVESNCVDNHIPVIIALNRHSLLNNYNHFRHCDRTHETRFVETFL